MLLFHKDRQPRSLVKTSTLPAALKPLKQVVDALTHTDPMMAALNVWDSDSLVGCNTTFYQSCRRRITAILSLFDQTHQAIAALIGRLDSPQDLHGTPRFTTRPPSVDRLRSLGAASASRPILSMCEYQSVCAKRFESFAVLFKCLTSPRLTSSL